MGIRPRLHPRSIRLIVPLGSEGAAALRARSVAEDRSIRSIVIDAVSRAGLLSALEEDEARRHGRRTGAGRPARKSDGYEISVDLPPNVMERLREVAQRRGVSIGHLVLKALLKTGIPILPHELLPDRRKRGCRTPRTHYANGVRRRKES